MASGKKILLYGLLGGGLLMFLLCGGVVFLVSRGMGEFPKVIAASDAFMDLLKDKQVDAAYLSTTPEFRAKVAEDQFQELVAKYPAFTNQANRSMGGMRIYSTGQGARGYVQYNLSNPNNTLSLNLVLKQVDGSWKVEGVNLP